MAKLVDLGGAPVNRCERDIVLLLKDNLRPNDRWSVIPNASLPDPRTGHAYEYDAIVVGPHAVYVVEVKGWRGHIRQLGGADWQLDSGRHVKNPLPLTDQKARIVASRLRKLDIDWPRAPYVQACLAVCDEEATFEVYGSDAGRCLRPSEIIAYLSDPDQLSASRRRADYRPHHRAIVEAIVGDLEARRKVGRRYGSYVVTDLQERDDDHAVWLGHHALLKDAGPVRVRAWYLSEYTHTPAERTAAVARLSRSAQALARIGAHPRIATLRDFGEDQGEFYEVTDWSDAGTIQTAFVRGALNRMTTEHKVRIVRDIAEALAAAYQHKVFHRALHPGAVLLDAEGRARLTGFDLAFMEGATGTVYGGAHPHLEYLPPELRDPNDYDVFDNSDLYALAKMARQLFRHQLPEAVEDLLDACLADVPDERPASPSAFLARLAQGDSEPTAPPERQPDPEPEPEPKPAPDTASSIDFAPGNTIDEVNTVLAQLGRGAGSVVYRVANEPLDRELALKLVVDPPEGYDPAAELRLLRAVDSPHVPHAHWLGRLARPDGGTLPYLLLDLVEGDRLSDRLARGPVALDDALAWANDLLEALVALHGASDGDDSAVILHRDVKADNIVIGPRGAVLVDFGTARDGTDPGRAPEGTLRTTPPDLAATGWGPQADVFAAGCVIYELLSGRPPWPSTPSEAATPAPASAGRPNLPPAVDAVLAKALAPRAADRFASGTAFRDALKRALRPAEPAPAPPIPRTTITTSVREAGHALWSASRVQALTRHPDLAVPLAQALIDCVVPAADDAPSAARDALIASEIQAAALEGPLPLAMPRAYDALLGGLDPSPLGSPEDEDSAAARIAGATADHAVWFDALHFSEWPLLLGAAASLGRPATTLAWAAAPDQAVPATAFVADAAPTGVTAVLPRGDRAAVDLGVLMERRRAAIQEALLAALSSGERVWAGAAAGLVYLGSGLRRDVGEGLGARADDARAAWSAAFPTGRSAPSGGGPLPCRLAEPLREAAGRRYPVGRLAWPDPPGTPWLQAGGLSLPERLLLLVRMDPAAAS